MISSLRPASALLAAFAAWCLALLVLALLGLGGRVGPHPDNPALAPPLPQVRLVEVGSRLGPSGDYIEVSNRPLLSPDRRPAAVTAAEGDAEAPLEGVLSGVLLAGEFRAALIQSPDGQRSQRVRVGELLEGTAWRLVELEPRRAVFEGPQGRRELELRVYDGRGDIVPAAAAAPPAPSRPSRRGGGPGPAPKGQEAAPAPAPATAAAPAEAKPEEASQEEQVEAIRRRIEARRAQMREDAARRNGQQVE